MTQSRFVESSPEIEVHLPDGRTLRGPRGATAAVLLAPIADDLPAPLVGVVVNGELFDLAHAIDLEARVRPVTMADADGARIYRRSLTYLLDYAFSRLYPEATLLIDHSLASGGYFCNIRGRAPLTSAELAALEADMRRIVGENLPFNRHEVTLAEAIAHFDRQKQADKSRLMRHRRKPTITLYQLGERFDDRHGYMVPSTGYLKWFDVVAINGGFALRYPRQHTPDKLPDMTHHPKLLASFRQYGAWLERLGIGHVGALDDAIQAGRSREIILVSEALHEQTIAQIARQIADRGKQARLVLISGPSSSGKTTFSRRLAVQLLTLGLAPFALELDNYFVDRTETPRDKNGELDYETIDALRLTQLADHLQRLLAGEEVQLPRYSFQEGRQYPGENVQLRPGQLIILEGIHGLNPRLIPPALAAQSFQVYASALTQLNLDSNNRVSTTDTRLIRRIVRDARDRGYDARATISRWESVRRGEKLHIFPFQENANVMFNSALAYELSVLRPFAEPILRQVQPGTPEYVEARRLLAYLEWFLPIDAEWVPDNSILREFVGGSILKDFKVWGV
ncbi:nucleoside kinase [Opitutus terrae]|uniref:Phosphoribulokinase/uridine kinase n=1 Tax=Opitutus terrae (strain DSM 11246 / JCM 15787 / PB90-1) TaxID=452637 RepID=B1ZPR8_OPITP|nr:nucleoside kinase [Opitutus terrae]ACB75521.1 phosphoribulokinase/uridine kinase [Opitutus terrae PB90-1]